jgi:hypothetical protein
MFGEFLPNNTDFKKTKKLTWLPFIRDLVPVSIRFVSGCLFS